MTQNPASQFESLRHINQTCTCVPLEQLGLDTSAQQVSITDKPLAVSTLFANTPVFLSQSDREQIDAVISAIYTLITLPAYRAHCTQRSPHIDHRDDDTQGLVSGFDFHLSAGGPQLIEVNTNAGGAFITQSLIREHNQRLSKTTELCSAHPFGNDIVITKDLRDMVLAEWQRAKRTGNAPAHLAIVDDNPREQFLYPDMLLARTLLQNNKTRVSIVASRDLHYQNGILTHRDQPVDMVYNRLTDFSLHDTANTALLRAWQDDAVVLSPSPLNHRLLADKRNLQLFSDALALRGFGLPETAVETLQSVPHTVALNGASEQELWQQRKQYYFKPVDGFGSKAVYRGSKITRRVWDQISKGSHVAQREIAPTRRCVQQQGHLDSHKFDVRAYAYNGRAIALVARMYQGQTTNFRTPAGGFAPIMVLPDWACSGSSNCC